MFMHSVYLIAQRIQHDVLIAHFLVSGSGQLAQLVHSTPNFLNFFILGNKEITNSTLQLKYIEKYEWYSKKW